jgi:manganese/zinc/iron transport system permease protein
VLALTSVTAVAAFDAVGAILFIAFVIVPPATAYLLTRRLWLMVALAVGLSVAACVSGYLLAVRWNVSIGGMMASMTGVWFALALLFAPGGGWSRKGCAGAERLDHDCRALWRISSLMRTRRRWPRKTPCARWSSICAGPSPAPAPPSCAPMTAA